MSAFESNRFLSRIVIVAKRAAMKPSRDLSHVRCVPRRCDELPAHAC